jgi:hypothetical protein
VARNVQKPWFLTRSQRPSAVTTVEVVAGDRELCRMSHMTGQIVTERLEYDGGRSVTAYVPPAAPEAIVFAGDGQLIAPWGALLEAAGLPPTMIVAAHRLEDETRRLHEYSPGESTAPLPLTRSGLRRTSGSLSRTSADGRSRALTSRCRPIALRCSASRRVQNSRSPWGFAIPTFVAQCCARHQARVSGHPP